MTPMIGLVYVVAQLGRLESTGTRFLNSVLSLINAWAPLVAIIAVGALVLGELVQIVADALTPGDGSVSFGNSGGLKKIKTVLFACIVFGAGSFLVTESFAIGEGFS